MYKVTPNRRMHGVSVHGIPGRCDGGVAIVQQSVSCESESYTSIPQILVVHIKKYI